MNTTAQHVIFGTGAIGLATLDALRRRGETARVINRSGHADVPDDVEVVGGDARDPAFAAAASVGARVLYQTLNPPYHEWTAHFPALQASVLAAAQATGARLVSMENVYVYGPAQRATAHRNQQLRRPHPWLHDGAASRSTRLARTPEGSGTALRSSGARDARQGSRRSSGYGQCRTGDRSHAPGC